ncbi:MAG: hypothetical protein H6716_28305 [Polyangiaceae bacterium]|nr:hypothetical protein [Polyangiaceae bacterium]
MLALKTEITGKRLRGSGADLKQIEAQLASSIAEALGKTIRERVQQRGDLAGQHFPGWDRLITGDDGIERGRRKWVSARYPDRAQGPVARSGAEYFKSSADYHAANGTLPGSYSTTGGMWSGLTVQLLTPTMARLRFRGRSEGQEARFRGGKARPVKVSNALKVWTVLHKHGVNVLALAESELVRLGVGLVQAIASGVQVTLPVSWEGYEPPQGRLADILGAALRGS